MEKEKIYEGKVKLGNKNQKVTIESGLDQAGKARFYITNDQSSQHEVMHNPETHHWDEAGLGETELAKVSGKIIEDFYS